MATAADGPTKRGSFNPFDSDVEDDALDPSHFGEDDDDLEEVDFKNILKKKKKEKSDTTKLQGAAKSVQVLDEEAKSSEVIGQVWEADEKALSSAAPAVSMRWNYYKRAHESAESPSSAAGSQRPVAVQHVQRAVPVADYSPLPVKETAKRIVLGKPYILEYYHTLKEKKELLREVVKLHDGNAILTVILFLKRTLRENLFLVMLLEYEVVENHYVSYLRQLGYLEQLQKFYTKLLRARKAAMLLYSELCVKEKVPAIRLRGLERCIDFCKSFEEMSKDVQHLKDELYLLKDVQMPLQRRDDEAERKQYAVFVQFPRSIPVTSASLMSTVFYSCMYHFSATEKDVFSPERLKKDFKLTDRQYMWMAVGARAKLRDYKNIEEKLLTVMGWFGRKNQKSAIGFEKVAEILRQYRAPEDEVVKYLRKTDDVNIRLEMAEKLDCPTVIIETLKEKRDRVALGQYRDRLPGHSSHRREADQLLVNTTIRWKN